MINRRLTCIGVDLAVLTVNVERKDIGRKTLNFTFIPGCHPNSRPRRQMPAYRAHQAEKIAILF